MIREPAVAGLFYEDNACDLRESIEAAYLGPYGPGRLPQPAPFVSRDIVGLIAPHAGYIYSGSAAAHAYAELADDGLPDTVILLGVNHRGVGAPAAIVCEGSWRTPLGEVAIDTRIAESLMKSTNLLEVDVLAHRSEHSLEVQVPFLQYLSPNIRIVPIALGVSPWDSLSRLYADSLGGAIAEVIQDRNIIVIASTDLTHHEPRAVAERQDNLAIAEMERLDSLGLLDVVESNNITMCGALPAAIALAASARLGASRGTLLSYYTSGDITGETHSVVGYGALKLTRSEA